MRTDRRASIRIYELHAVGLRHAKEVLFFFFFQGSIAACIKGDGRWLVLTDSGNVAVVRLEGFCYPCTAHAGSMILLVGEELQMQMDNFAVDGISLGIATATENGKYVDLLLAGPSRG